RADRCLEHRESALRRDLAFDLVRPELRVKGEFALAVDCRHESAAVGVEGDVHPGRGMRHDAIELGRAQIEREHAPAEEVADGTFLAGIAQSQRLSHGSAPLTWSARIRCEAPS